MSTTERALILVVDDEPGVRLILSGLLGQLGYRTLEAESARDGLKLIEREPVEVVITDLKMPGEDGLWLLDQVRVRSPFVPVIMLTAHGSVETAVQAMRHGAFDFLTKPLDRDALIQALDKALPVSARLFSASGELDLVAESPQMQGVLKLCQRMSKSQAPVLVTGPSGSGKEVVAKALHAMVGDSGRPFIAVNCGAIPETLLESELFGHTKGAFTGATCDKPGRVELAQGGTLFLDEIGDISPPIQVKLLRLVQEKTYERVGGLGTKTADIRIVAATHRDLAAMVKTSDFREDLFFRLNVLPINLPPLRERPEDIAPLARAFLAKAAETSGRTPPALSVEAVAHLEQLPWSGNARELGNLMERLAVLTESNSIGVGDIEECRGLDAPEQVAESGAVTSEGPEAEKARILDALSRAGGKRTLAAKLLGVSRRTLYNKLERHEIN